MTLLILGLALWSGAHLFKRMAPELRAQMGAAGKGALAAAIALSVVLMYYGYGMVDGPYWWGRNPALTGINNLLMVLAVYLFAAAGMKTALARKMRNPMLIGVKVWALAHLLVNGDLGSFVLFGGLMAWAVAQGIVIKRTAPIWEKPPVRGAKYEAMAVLGTVIVTGLLMGIHNWLGYQPWG